MYIEQGTNKGKTAAGEVIQGNPLPFCYAESGGRCNLASRANMDVCNLASNVCMDVSTQTVLLGSTLKPGSAPGRSCRLAAEWRTGKERAMRKWKIGGTAGGIFDRPFKKGAAVKMTGGPGGGGGILF